MRNVHDVGGQLGYGPIDVRADDGRVFHSPYESLAFALTMASGANGFFHNADERRFAMERLPPDVYVRCAYWERWLAAAEMKLVENGVLDFDAIREREQTVDPGATAPAAAPEGLNDAIDNLIARGRALAGQLPEPHRYAVGQRVHTRVTNNRHHTRLPGYAMGREGVVVAQLPAFPLPDAVASDPDGPSEWTYRVRFEARELWGQDGGAHDVVMLDAFESYLRATNPTTASSDRETS
ncbi:nitrile hydratase subunit beta [Actinopolymorpha pittospori]|uniref:Nitrile hydratase subunit beta n=1 Tax=Actinopolymorpha pittospori TaxID=648752 RepID=A0A927N466_9ACTN|nr:nitrile hydratase subunit beta [Actinopolymorpha pittospori]MBE1612011.1 nitrile hydratase [Actinopolymorpha pittospori]